MQCISVLFFRACNSLIIPTLLIFTLSACAGMSGQNAGTATDNASDLIEVKPGDYRALIQKSPADLITSGNIHLQNRNLDLARIHFTTANEKQPYYLDAYIGLGKIEMHLGNYNRALDFFSAAEKIDSGSVEALVGQAQALRFTGKMNAAIEKINAAMTIAPNSIIILKELAILYDLTHQESLAEPLYEEIVSRAPDVAANHNNLGMNLMVQKKYPEAILAFLQALSINRDNVRVKNNLATAYALHGNQLKALKLFTSTVGEAAAYNNLGYLYMTQGKLTEAKDALEKAVAVSPTYYVKAQENISRLNQLLSESQQQN